MPTNLLLLAGLLLLLDAAVRTWRPWRARVGANLVYLAVAWVPFFALPFASEQVAMIAAAAAGLLALFDFSRMVGLTQHPRFFIPCLIMAALSFPLAAARLEAEFSALPVLALLVVVAVGVASKNAQAFLQKLCLAWLSVLVYGYLYAHAVLFVGRARLGLPGPVLLALIILLAKCADIAWVLGRRTIQRERLQLLASPIGGLLGGIAVAALVPALPARLLWPLGLAIGVGLGFGSRAYSLIVADVTGEATRQLKGTMLFGFGLALAVGYWTLVLLAQRAFF
jgi:hypothetical protein